MSTKAIADSTTEAPSAHVSYDEYIPFAEKACEYLSISPDPFHAVKNGIAKLVAAGYCRVSKRESFTGTVQPGKRASGGLGNGIVY